MAEIRLYEEAARDGLLVRAIEGEDPEATVLTRDDREYAATEPHLIESCLGLHSTQGAR